MKLMVDINVLLDVFLDRQPHAPASEAVWSAVESGIATGYVAAHGVTTLYYLVGKYRDAAVAHRVVEAVTDVFRIAPVNELILKAALAARMADFEDAVTAAAAELQGCEFIVTRDPKGFRRSAVRAVTPEFAAADF